MRINGCPWDEETCANAGRGGELEVLQWLRANGCPWDEGTCEWRRLVITLSCCSGHERTAARGTRKREERQR